jgi:hypothetical protein
MPYLEERLILNSTLPVLTIFHLHYCALLRKLQHTVLLVEKSVRLGRGTGKVEIVILESFACDMYTVQCR